MNGSWRTEDDKWRWEQTRVTDTSPGAHKCQTWRVRMTVFMCEDSWGLSKSDTDVVGAPVQNAPSNPSFLSAFRTIWKSRWWERNARSRGSWSTCYQQYTIMPRRRFNPLVMTSPHWGCFIRTAQQKVPDEMQRETNTCASPESHGKATAKAIQK